MRAYTHTVTELRCGTPHTTSSQCSDCKDVVVSRERFWSYFLLRVMKRFFWSVLSTCKRKLKSACAASTRVYFYTRGRAYTHMHTCMRSPCKCIPVCGWCSATLLTMGLCYSPDHQGCTAREPFDWGGAGSCTYAALAVTALLCFRLPTHHHAHSFVHHSRFQHADEVAAPLLAGPRRPWRLGSLQCIHLLLIVGL